MSIDDLVAAEGLSLARTQLPDAVPAIVVGAHLLCAETASDDDVRLVLAAERLRHRGPFTIAEARDLAGVPAPSGTPRKM